LARKFPLIKPSSSAFPRKVIVPLLVLISSFTDWPKMKLGEGNAPDVIVPVPKQVSNVIAPLRPKLPCESALP